MQASRSTKASPPTPSSPSKNPPFASAKRHKWKAMLDTFFAHCLPQEQVHFTHERKGTVLHVCRTTIRVHPMNGGPHEVCGGECWVDGEPQANPSPTSTQRKRVSESAFDGHTRLRCVLVGGSFPSLHKRGKFLVGSSIVGVSENCKETTIHLTHPHHPANGKLHTNGWHCR